jgi:hypothetical protein
VRTYELNEWLLLSGYAVVMIRFQRDHIVVARLATTFAATRTFALVFPP